MSPWRVSGQSAFAELTRRAARYAGEHRGRLAIAVVLAVGPPLAVGIAVGGTKPHYESSARLATAPGSVLLALNGSLGLAVSGGPVGGVRLAYLADPAAVRSAVRAGAGPHASTTSVSLRIDPVIADVIVTARSGDRREARRVARGFATAVVRSRDRLLRKTLVRTRKELARRRGVRNASSDARVRALRRKLATLRTLAPSGSAGVTVAQGPGGERAVGTNPGRDLRAALVLGLLLAATFLAVPELRARRAAASPAG